MKRIVCLCVILLCSISFAFAQSENAGLKKKKTVVKKKIVSPFAEAEEAWILFWMKFSRATKSQNKETLKELISKNYLCDNNSGECSCENFADKREIFFCIQNERLWEYLEAFLLDKKATQIRKIAKVKGEITREVNNRNYPGNGSFYFKYDLDGKWYLIGWDIGETA